MLALLIAALLIYILVFLPMVPDSSDDIRPRSGAWFLLALLVSLLVWYFLLRIVL